ncbi:hypothetical protein SBV1_480007 [Verrucomicrobia bacterium]|nr:hypothetical protein SBV1_480007 [Verrucomicrobiota bacterium]
MNACKVIIRAKTSLTELWTPPKRQLAGEVSCTRLRRATTFCLSLVAATSACLANLVQNGGFETGDFADWTQSGNANGVSVSTNYLYVHSGQYGPELGPVGTLGYLSQTVSTSPGTSNQISFWLDSPDGLGPNEFLVQWNGTTIFDETNLPAVGWTNLQFVVTATGTNSLLEFGFRDDPSYLGLDDISVVGQSGTQTNLYLPVYQVAKAGASLSQAQSLAHYLNVPADRLVVSNGLVSFIDPTNWLNIPTVAETDPTVISGLEAVTRNQDPSIPLSFQRVDFQALNNRPVFDTNTAVAVFSNALSGAYLVPASLYNGFIYGIPVTSFTLFNGFYSSGSAILSATHALDTEVNYLMYDRNGYPVIGPGMQVQAAFDGYGNTTRLLYSARELTPGPTVEIISATEAINRVARLLPASAQITAQLVYWVPPFRPPLPWPPCYQCPPVPWNPTNVLPWYECQGTLYETNPLTGQTSPVNLKVRMIPATDDPAFVPSVNLSAYVQGSTQVAANASVVGGTPPYTYSWGVPGNITTSNSGAYLIYTPVVRFSPPVLQVMPASAPGALVIYWNPHPIGPGPDPGPDAYVLESATDLTLGSNAWSQVTSPIETNGNGYSVTVATTAAQMFFRLRLVNPMLTHTETVGVTVTDANGISVYASQVLSVVATIIPATKGNVPISYGCESPREPDFAVDRIGWQDGMGTPNAGGGVQSFCWMGDLAWPGDFIEPNPPGTLEATPWVYGDADYSNWGVNSASIVLNNTDGWANGFCSSQPGATIAQYPTAELLQPSASSTTVVIGLDQNNDTINTHSYSVNYNGSWCPVGPNDGLCWLAMDCCDVLDEYDGYGVYAVDRWSPAFGGLHIMTGWNSEEQVGDGSFEKDFALNMLGVNGPPQTVLQAWFNAAQTAGVAHGTPAAMGPFGPDGLSDYQDYYWGKGPVGANFLPGQITGWWYVQNTLQPNPPH